MDPLVLLLPARPRLPGTVGGRVARALGRADTRPAGEAGGQAQLLRYFDLLPRGWPAAALTRQLDAGDAGQAAWLRADPAWVRPDINGARLLAYGEGMQVDADDVARLLPSLRTLFGDAGFPIDAPDPRRWYLRLPREARLPWFPPPDDALGSDIFEQLPGSGDASPEARRWRALSSEAQVVLHNHPWNARRAEAGKPPVNSLWFWGSGVLPDHVQARGITAVASDDTVLRAVAAFAGCTIAAAGPGRPVPEAGRLVDLRTLPSGADLAEAWLGPALDALDAGTVPRVVLDFADGQVLWIERRQRWRFWRRPATGFGPRAAP